MQLKDFPYELVSRILDEVAEANIRAGPTYTFGLSQAPLPFQISPIQRYVKGPIPLQMLKWDASYAIRNVCWQWHEWALEYALKAVYIRRWKGGERWVELSNRRTSYPFSKELNDFPKLASKIKRMWFHGFYTAETNRMIFETLKNCSNLAALSVSWTMVRHLDAESWRTLLIGDGQPLQSLELQCIDPTSQEAAEKVNQVDLHALRSVDFGHLKRLKVFGDTNCMPITDEDLFAIARTATQLEEFHLTCISTITIDDVMAVVKASRDTLRVLEHSPPSRTASGTLTPETLAIRL
ncbi:hypothetical protein E8E12_000377 [Didymella heteroderae]|uniref:F-box domain-containing protein n=1 Tax=Didymella heteroderae TaxID=1769908 RepID=A0A9P4WFN6_9PLEO|nr:hypothetical protein E8E12_000377 [Didymella heteroderae]